MAVERKSAAELDLRLQGLDHFNLPVRDLNVARKFYCEVLGGIVTAEPDWSRHAGGRSVGAHIDFQIFNAEGHLNAYWQPWGQPAPDQPFPHRAFRVASAAALDEFIGRLEAARVPHVLVTPTLAAPGATVPTALHFRDPDMNQLELRCDAYPFRTGIHVQSFEPSALWYRWEDWRAMVPEGGAPSGRLGAWAPKAT